MAYRDGREIVDIRNASQGPDGSYLDPIIVKQQTMSAFGDNLVAEMTPVAFIVAQYGLLESQLELSTNANGYINRVENEAFVGVTAGAPGSIGLLRSRAVMNYKPGIGSACRFTARFPNQGVAGTSLRAGLANATDTLAFGYIDDSELGVVHAHHAANEIQQLTVTVAASGATNATVTIAGVPYTVPLTNAAGNTSFTAMEISNSLEAQLPTWDFVQSNNTVKAARRQAGTVAGAFLFSHATAQASWSQVTSGHAATVDFVERSNWDYNPVELDPVKGNIYRIRFRYLGYGSIEYSWFDPAIEYYRVVYRKIWENQNEETNMAQPSYRLSFAATSGAGIASNEVVTASAFLYQEGPTTERRAIASSSTTAASIASSGVDQAVLVLRNATIFDGIFDVGINLFLQSASFFADTTKTGIFTLWRNPTFSGNPIWSPISGRAGLIAKPNGSYNVIDGTNIGTFLVGNRTATVDLKTILNETVSPGETFAIAAYISSGAASEVTVSLIWAEEY